MGASQHHRASSRHSFSPVFLLVFSDVGREQELKVYRARRSLEEALTADSLARAAESTQATLRGETA